MTQVRHDVLAANQTNTPAYSWKKGTHHDSASYSCGVTWTYLDYFRILVLQSDANSKRIKILWRPLVSVPWMSLTLSRALSGSSNLCLSAMANTKVYRATAIRKVSFHDPKDDHQQLISEMTTPIPINNSRSREDPRSLSTDAVRSVDRHASSTSSSPPEEGKSPRLDPSIPGSPLLSRHGSFSAGSSYQEDWEAYPPLDRLTVFDILENFALPQQLEKLQSTISAQTEKVKRQRDVLKTRGSYAKDRVVEEWRRRLPPADEQLDRYRRKMRDNVDRLSRRWNDTKAVTMREKLAFIGGVSNIFISGYLIGAWPQYFHIWYTGQLLYFMPVRYYSYHKRGYHYFLADLCYFVNFLLLLSLWVFPQSKRLFISTFCLAMGNNAVAIAMWRNSLVFHSLDKVTR